MSERIIDMLDLFYANKHLNQKLYCKRGGNVKNLKWNVMYHDFNRDNLEVYNIFEHGSFRNYFEKIHKEFKKTDDKDGFAYIAKRELRIHFWSKSEWEVVITKKDGRIIMSPWRCSRNNPKLDVTDNEDFDWVGFYDYMKEKQWADKEGKIKIDVYSQIMYRFDEFIDYCWTEC